MALFQMQNKPLPSLPSPTLTNPEMVLPDEGPFAQNSSPMCARRPPSPGYLRNATSQQVGSTQTFDRSAKKEKRGLMSRKMMLLRSRTGSGLAQGGSHTELRNAPSESSTDDRWGRASSETVQELGIVGQEQRERKRRSIDASSFTSNDLAALPAFLSKYSNDGAGEDELTDIDSPSSRPLGYSVTIEGGVDAQRRAQEEDEQNSAILSRRAEQILANAKRRLNVRVLQKFRDGPFANRSS